MSVQIESLFTAALGLQAPWTVERVDLSTAKRRIDFEVTCKAKRVSCPHCGATEQGIHDRMRRKWRHLDFFQFEAWLNAEVPRVACTACGKTTQMPVPWAREGSGFTLLFEALSLTLCQDLPVRQAAQMLRVRDKQLWRRIEHYVDEARAGQDMSAVRIVGIDETSLERGQQYVTVVHDLVAKRLLFATEGREHTAGGRTVPALPPVCRSVADLLRKAWQQVAYARFSLGNREGRGALRDPARYPPLSRGGHRRQHAARERRPASG